MAYNFICQDLYSGTDIPAIIADKIEKGELGVKTGRASLIIQMRPVKGFGEKDEGTS